MGTNNIYANKYAGTDFKGDPLWADTMTFDEVEQQILNDLEIVSSIDGNGADADDHYEITSEGLKITTLNTGPIFTINKDYREYDIIKLNYKQEDGTMATVFSDDGILYLPGLETLYITEWHYGERLDSLFRLHNQPHIQSLAYGDNSKQPLTHKNDRMANAHNTAYITSLANYTARYAQDVNQSLFFYSTTTSQYDTFDTPKIGFRIAGNEQDVKIADKRAHDKTVPYGSSDGLDIIPLGGGDESQVENIGEDVRGVDSNTIELKTKTATQLFRVPSGGECGILRRRPRTLNIDSFRSGNYEQRGKYDDKTKPYAAESYLLTPVRIGFNDRMTSSHARAAGNGDSYCSIQNVDNICNKREWFSDETAKNYVHHATLDVAPIYEGKQLSPYSFSTDENDGYASGSDKDPEKISSENNTIDKGIDKRYGGRRPPWISSKHYFIFDFNSGQQDIYTGRFGGENSDEPNKRRAGIGADTEYKYILDFGDFVVLPHEKNILLYNKSKTSEPIGSFSEDTYDSYGHACSEQHLYCSCVRPCDVKNPDAFHKSIAMYSFIGMNYEFQSRCLNIPKEFYLDIHAGATDKMIGGPMLNAYYTHLRPKDREEANKMSLTVTQIPGFSPVTVEGVTYGDIYKLNEAGKVTDSGDEYKNGYSGAGCVRDIHTRQGDDTKGLLEGMLSFDMHNGNFAYISNGITFKENIAETSYGLYGIKNEFRHGWLNDILKYYTLSNSETTELKNLENQCTTLAQNEGYYGAHCHYFINYENNSVNIGPPKILKSGNSTGNSVTDGKPQYISEERFMQLTYNNGTGDSEFTSSWPHDVSSSDFYHFGTTIIPFATYSDHEVYYLDFYESDYPYEVLSDKRGGNHSISIVHRPLDENDRKHIYIYNHASQDQGVTFFTDKLDFYGYRNDQIFYNNTSISVPAESGVMLTSDDFNIPGFSFEIGAPSMSQSMKAEVMNHTATYLTVDDDSSATVSFKSSAKDYIEYSGNGLTGQPASGTYQFNQKHPIFLRGQTRTSQKPLGNGLSLTGSQIRLVGNLAVLLNYKTEEQQKNLQLPNDAFKNWFADTDLQYVSENLLPFKNLGTSCYERLFENCVKFETILSLPATKLANRCYAHMFADCTSLTTAPTLPVTTLTDYCYSYMFSGCTGLTTAPELPARIMASYCYSGMFSGCEITTPPVLPATTLADYCYEAMFDDCIYLTIAPELPVTTLANGCYKSMFYNCARLTVAPVLPATVLKKECYQGMFRDSAITSAPYLANINTVAEECCRGMFLNTDLEITPILPDVYQLAKGCYQEMFCGCRNLKEIASAENKIALPTLQLAESCYEGMFAGCVVLNQVPKLLATDLPNKCYKNMFYSCSSLGIVSSSGSGSRFTIPGTPEGGDTSIYVTSHGEDYVTDMFTGSNGDVSTPRVIQKDSTNMPIYSVSQDPI